MAFVLFTVSVGIYKCFYFCLLSGDKHYTQEQPVQDSVVLSIDSFLSFTPGKQHTNSDRQAVKCVWAGSSCTCREYVPDNARLPFMV